MRTMTVCKWIVNSIYYSQLLNTNGHVWKTNFSLHSTPQPSESSNKLIFAWLVLVCGNGKIHWQDNTPLVLEHDVGSKKS